MTTPPADGPAVSSGAASQEAFLERKLDELGRAVAELGAAPPFAKPRYQTQVLRLSSELLDSDSGLRKLFDLIPEAVSAGIFHGGPWEHASRLLPSLVGYSLKGDGINPTIEAVSELRILAIATGALGDDDLEPEQAEQFLQEVCVQNLDLLFPESCEESRERPKIYARAERLFALVREHISIAGFGNVLIEELETISAQRPIVTRRIEKMIDLARQLPEGVLKPKATARLNVYVRALGRVSAASADVASLQDYGAALEEMSSEQLREEAEAFAGSIHGTGLTSPYHAVLVRRLVEAKPRLVEKALGLDGVGVACLEQNRGLVHSIVEASIGPSTHMGVLGLAGTLDRGLLSRPEIRAGFRRLLDAEMTTEVARRLKKAQSGDDSQESKARLIGGTLSLLGSPLGVGQGNNPTCQAARALSLWSQHAPGLLLRMLVRVVRHGIFHTGFEQHDLLIREEFDGQLASTPLDLDLDPVSAVMVPLLDRLYARLLELTRGRLSDPHRWVNPAMYGSWVPGGFAAAFHPITGALVGHSDFVRLFFATHHPRYNGGFDLVFPNPVGIIPTDVHGNMLGYHAVSIQRIAADPVGHMRVYFYNPNNEGRQRWGGGVSPTVAGHGECPGESSLPFAQFASRLYAFHYDHYEKGDPARVSPEVVAKVSRMSRDSWGRAVVWADAVDDGSGLAADVRCEEMS